VLRSVAALTQPLQGSTLRVRAHALIGPDGHAVLVDNRIAGGLSAEEQRLARLGYRRVDAPFVVVDHETNEVVLADAVAVLGVDTVGLERSWPVPVGGDGLLGGRVPIRTIVHWEGSSDVSIAARGADLAAMVVTANGTLATDDLRRLLQLVDRLGTTPIRSFDRGTLARTIAVG
jgi:hypothetical protein